jgi:hypothetical protein
MSTSSQLKTADVYIVHARIAIMVEVPNEVMMGDLPHFLRWLKLLPLKFSLVLSQKKTIKFIFKHEQAPYLEWPRF